MSGEVAHRGKICPGQHTAIITPDLFDQVQQQLAIARVERQHGRNLGITCNAIADIAHIRWEISRISAGK